jgi:glycosyltransferase involved in cell wall biosynthesis
LILAAGRLWDEAKGIAALAEIAPKLSWPVCVAGPAQEPGLDGPSAPRNGVDYLGVLSHPAMLSQMRRAGIFTSPALYEPFGLGVLEAAASGCALVLTDIPSFRELWTGAALFVAAGDQHALQNALQLLCEDEERRKQLQSSARARARRYSLEATTAAYGDLYARLMVPFHAPPKAGCNIAVLQG